jgi:adenylosuccinate synthase
VLYNCVPVYEDLDGWSSDISGASSYAELPAQAREYVERIEELVEVPITSVGIGPKRTDTLVRDRT